jgi:hypothetical protein
MSHELCEILPFFSLPARLIRDWSACDVFDTDMRHDFRQSLKVRSDLRIMTPFWQFGDLFCTIKKPPVAAVFLISLSVCLVAGAGWRR